MPNIEEFNAGSGELNIPEGGAQANVQAARHVGATYAQIGQDITNTVKPMGEAVIQHQADVEANNLYTAYYQAKTNGQNSWDQTIASPDAVNRPDLAQSFMDKFGQAVDEIGAHAQTQQGKTLANRLSNSLKEEMFTRVHGDVSALTGATYVNNIDKIANMAQERIANDPSSAATEIGNFQDFVANAAIPSNVSGETRARLTEHFNTVASGMALGAYRSSIEQGRAQVAAGGPPTILDQVSKDLDAGKLGEYVGGQTAELRNAVDTARRQGQEQLSSAARVQQEAQDREGKGVAAQLYARATQEVAAGQTVDPDTLAAIHQFPSKYPGLFGESGELQRLVPQAIKDAETGTFTQSNPQVLTSFQSRLSIPPGQPGALSMLEVIKAQNDHTISPEAGGRLVDQMEKIGKDPDYGKAHEDITRWMDMAIRPQLTQSAALGADGMPTSLGGTTKDPKGDVVYAEARREVYATFEARIHGGMTPAQAEASITDPKNNFLQKTMPYWQQGRNSPDPSSFFYGHPVTPGTPGGPPAANGLPAGAARPMAGGGSVSTWSGAGDSVAAVLKRNGY